MQTASMSEFRTNLSRYIREVRRGEEIEVLRRGKLVARLVPLAPSAKDDRQRPIEAGVPRPGTGDGSVALRNPPLKIPGARLSEAVIEDREDRG